MKAKKVKLEATNGVQTKGDNYSAKKKWVKKKIKIKVKENAGHYGLVTVGSEYEDVQIPRPI